MYEVSDLRCEGTVAASTIQYVLDAQSVKLLENRGLVHPLSRPVDTDKSDANGIFEAHRELFMAFA